MAGCITLIKAVTSSLSVYTMQTVKLSITICNKIDNLNKSFLWGHDVSESKVHLVNWDTICSPISRGGLGVQKTQSMNRALLAKAAWRLHSEGSGLWADIFNHKYPKGKSILEYKKGYFLSPSWRGICDGMALLEKGVLWRVGNGSFIQFWLDY